MMKGLWMVLAYFTKIYLFIFLMCECFPYMYAYVPEEGARSPETGVYGWL